MAIDLTKFIAKFAEEAREHLEIINNSLVIFEKDPDNSELLDIIFRSFHTIKGSSKILKLVTIANLAHKVEDIFDAIRSGKIQIGTAVTDLVLQAVDKIEEMVGRAAAGADVPEAGSDLIARLEAIIQKDTSQTPPKSDSVPVMKEETKPAEPVEKTALFKSGDSVRVSIERLDEIIKLMGEIVSNQNRLKYSMLDIQKIEKLIPPLLNRLMDFTEKLNDPKNFEITIFQPFGELFKTVRTIASRTRDDINIQELLTHELQDKALKMRMMPLSTIFNTFPRTIRDISHSMSKKIEFSVKGGETELDKKMIEKLGDPLMHMIRNAIDHGIESTEIRLANGKSEVGSIDLSAYYEGGTVVIKLQDDGAGLSKEKLKAKALEKNLFDENTLRTMENKDVYDIIFHPGFSTRTNITDISGRGVGLDVVKRNIVNDLKGSIQIETSLGQGTAFFIRLPLTLSIMSVLLIESAGMIFALPSNSVSEVLRVPNSDLIDVMSRKAIKLRDHLIPVVWLDSLLTVPGDTVTGKIKKMNLIIILNIGEERLGVVIDSLISEEDMVIKPLPSHLKNNVWVTGIAITGKNELVNVLHIPTLFVNAKKSDGSASVHSQAILNSSPAKILVVDDSYNTREIEKSILEEGGYIVHIAHDGEDGLKKAQQTQYDLIVTDCDMPKMNGFNLTKNLRRDENYKDKPIIIVTARDKEEDRLLGMEVGADAYITKGTFNQNVLLETVDSLIG